ncbi:MAG: epoxyqueuosine reductase QueH [Spirochaetota bacterium]
MKKILLHSCCAPCACYVSDIVSREYSVSLFYCNPNISPPSEYERRKNECLRFAADKGYDIIEEKPDVVSWMRAVKPHAYKGERSERCWICYRIRMDAAFRTAVKGGFDSVGTVLTISPHKDAARINAIGRELSSLYGIPFLAADFKKQDGFKKSAVLSAQYGFYRQDYCGCVFSLLERKKSSRWYEEALARRRAESDAGVSEK